MHGVSDVYPVDEPCREPGSGGQQRRAGPLGRSVETSPHLTIVTVELVPDDADHLVAFVPNLVLATLLVPHHGAEVHIFEAAGLLVQLPTVLHSAVELDRGPDLDDVQIRDADQPAGRVADLFLQIRLRDADPGEEHPAPGLTDSRSSWIREGED